MALYELPPWLTRQYDFAGGFRSIGDAVVQGMQRRRQLELQEAAQRQRAEESAADRAMREKEFRLRQQERVDRLRDTLERQRLIREYNEERLKLQKEGGGIESTGTERGIEALLKTEQELREDKRFVGPPTESQVDRRSDLELKKEILEGQFRKDLARDEQFTKKVELEAYSKGLSRLNALDREIARVKVLDPDGKPIPQGIIEAERLQDQRTRLSAELERLHGLLVPRPSVVPQNVAPPAAPSASVAPEVPNVFVPVMGNEALKTVSPSEFKAVMGNRALKEVAPRIPANYVRVRHKQSKKLGWADPETAKSAEYEIVTE